MAYKISSLLLPILFLMTSCQGQQEEQVASTHQDIETTPPMYYGVPEDITSVDTTAGWNGDEQNILVKGVVYKLDGTTPASAILIYYYHTNAGGRYLHKSEVVRSLPPNQEGMSHGHLRGWIKTDAKGRYSIYTSKPGSYPSRDEPAHIHLTIKEPDLEEHYYIDAIVFDDDPLLTIDKRNKYRNRGGSGVVSLTEKEGVFFCNRDITLGLNLPDYRE